MKQKRTYTILLFLLILKFGVSQDKAIRVYNPTSSIEEEVIFVENQRIRIKTKYGKTISGKFKFLKNNKLLIRDEEIKLDHIVKIKPNPIAQTILVSIPLSFLTVIGPALGIGTGYLNSAYALAGLTGGAVSGYVLYRSPNILKGYSLEKGWYIEVIDYSGVQDLKKQ